MSDIEKYEDVIRELEAKKARLVARDAAIASERATLGYAAHVDDDAKARAKVGKLNAEAVTLAGELESITAALRTAGERLAAARQAEAVAADKANALALREELQAFCKHGMRHRAARERSIGAW